VEIALRNDFDLKGVFHALKHEISHMLGTGGGAIVDTASIAGVIADPGPRADRRCVRASSILPCFSRTRPSQ
jgi:hypothetical protein